MEIVRSHWQKSRGGADFDAFWRKSLHDGIVAGTSLPPQGDRPETGRRRAGARVARRPGARLCPRRRRPHGPLPPRPCPLRRPLREQRLAPGAAAPPHDARLGQPGARLARHGAEARREDGRRRRPRGRRARGRGARLRPPRAARRDDHAPLRRTDGRAAGRVGNGTGVERLPASGPPRRLWEAPVTASRTARDVRRRHDAASLQHGGAEPRPRRHVRGVPEEPGLRRGDERSRRLQGPSRSIPGSNTSTTPGGWR